MEACPECGDTEPESGGCNARGEELGECHSCGWTWVLEDQEPSGETLDRWNSRHVY